jgi:predicted transcriptional regulator
MLLHLVRHARLSPDDIAELKRLLKEQEANQ